MWQDCIRKLTPAIVIAIAAMLLAACSGLQQLDSQTADAAATAVPAAAQRDYQQVLDKLAAEDDRTAIVKLEKFIARYPDYPGAYANLAMVYDRQNRSAEALEALDIAVSIDQDFAPAYNRIGIIKRREGEFEAAEQAWLTAIAADPEYSYAWHNLGILYDLYLGDLPTALEHYERYQLLTLNQEDKQIDRWVADLQRRLGEPPRTARVGEQP